MKWIQHCKVNRKDPLIIEGSSFDESGAIIEEIHDGTFNLYEIPSYGGSKQFYGNYTTISEAKYIAESWT